MDGSHKSAAEFVIIGASSVTGIESPLYGMGGEFTHGGPIEIFLGCQAFVLIDHVGEIEHLPIHVDGDMAKKGSQILGESLVEIKLYIRMRRRFPIRPQDDDGPVMLIIALVQCPSAALLSKPVVKVTVPDWLILKRAFAFGSQKKGQAPFLRQDSRYPIPHFSTPVIKEME
jgi:hypothetical protein